MWTPSQRKYAKTPKGIEARKRFQQSKKGKALRAKYLAKKKAQRLKAKENKIVNKNSDKLLNN